MMSNTAADRFKHLVEGYKAGRTSVIGALDFDLLDLLIRLDHEAARKRLAHAESELHCWAHLSVGEKAVKHIDHYVDLRVEARANLRRTSRALDVLRSLRTEL